MTNSSPLIQPFWSRTMGPLLPESPDHLSSILDDPEDVLRRLAYADWLETHDQATRADLIRQAIILRKLEPYTIEWNTQLNRVVSLLHVYRPCFDLVGGLPRIHLESPLAGLIEQIEFTSTQVLFQTAPNIFRAIPSLHRLHVTLEGKDRLEIERFLDLPELERFSEICLCHCQINSPAIARFTESGRFTSLRVLDLSVNQICWTGFESLIGFARKARLRDLDLRKNLITKPKSEIQQKFGSWIRV
jgi:uncharacterized protein (TIGR02996 family)